MTAHDKIIPDPAGQVVGTVQLKKIGNSTGMILSKEMMARLNLTVGDTFYATLTPEGGSGLPRMIRTSRRPWKSHAEG